MQRAMSMALLVTLLLGCTEAGKPETPTAKDDATIDRELALARLEVARKLSAGWEGAAPRLFPSETCSDIPTRGGPNGILFESVEKLVEATKEPLPEARALATCRAESSAAMEEVMRTSDPWTHICAEDHVDVEGRMKGAGLSTQCFGEGGDPPALLAALRRFDAATAGCRAAAEAAGLRELDWGPSVADAGNCAVLPK